MNASAAGLPDTDALVHWLVSGLELEATVFHLGQYCGQWRASTAGRSLASFHLLLRGRCYLHLEQGPPIALEARDGVFFLRDVPHALSSEPELRPGAHRTMQPLSPAQPGGTDLACGFFHFRNALSELLIGSFPDYLIVRADAPRLEAVPTLFGLILAEAEACGGEPSPLIARLTELLFFYVVRHVAGRDEVSASLWAAARRAEFAPLLQELVREPGRNWSVQVMARRAHMSRASFFKHFVATCGQPPAQFVLLLRMKIAAQRLHRGDSISDAAEHVGYRSHAAFSRAFKRVNGEHPGAYQRARRRGALAPGGRARTAATPVRGSAAELDERAQIVDGRV